MNWMTLVKVTRSTSKIKFYEDKPKPPSAMPEERPVSKVTFSTMYIRIFRIPIGKVICIIAICIFLIIPLVLRTKNIKANEIHQLALHSNKSKWSFHKTHGAKPESFLTFREMLDIAQKQDPRTKAIWGFSDSVTKKDVDILNVTLPPLLKFYRNPCWIEYLNPLQQYKDSYYSHDCLEINAVKHSFSWSMYNTYLRRQNAEFYRMRCYPYFFVLGVTKSGTTDLYYSISRYLKDVISGARKEPHFWNRRRHGIHTAGSCINSYNGGPAQVSDYLDLYDEAAEKMRMRTKATRGYTRYHHLVTGDFTPATLSSAPLWWQYPGNEGLPEPRYTTPHYLYALRPRTKFIIILRDPVERAFSQMRYRHLPTSGSGVAETFHKLVVDTLIELHECTNLRGCVYNKTEPSDKNSAGNQIIIPGLYSIFVYDWLKVFPRDQFLFLRFEDYIKRRDKEIDKVSHFLDIDPLLPEDRPKLNARNVKNKGTTTEDMWPHTRVLLQKFYRPWNVHLAKMLQSDTLTWGY